MLSKLKYLLALIFIISISACSEDPNSIGENQLKEDYLDFKEVVFDSVTSLNSTTQTVNTGISGSLLLGNYNETEASFLVKFAVLLQDSIKEMLTNNSLSVISSYVEMSPNYRLGEGELNNIEINEIIKNWGTFKFNSDSLIGIANTQNLADSISATDSLYRIKINNDIVNSWLRSNIDQSIKNNGIYFKSSDQNKIVGFQSLDGSEDILSEGVMNLIVTIKNDKNQQQTLYFAPIQDVHVVKLNNASFLSDENYFYVQGGVAINSFIKFDLSDINKSIFVNDASLELSYDTLKSFLGNPPTDQLIITLTDSTNNIKENAILYKSGNKYIGSINRMVQMLLQKNSQASFNIKINSEESKAGRLAFYSPKYEVAELRPKLIIRYSQFF